MKILFINSQFERGGAARVASILANGLKRKGHEVVLVTDWSNWRCSYDLDENIPIKEIQTKGYNSTFLSKLRKWLECSKRIRSYIKDERPDVIISIEAMMYLCSWLGNIGLKTPLIAADHTSFNRKIDPIIDYVRYHLYSRADGLSILTEKDKKLLGNKYPQKTVIYNPLSFPILNAQVKRRKNILCAGRIESWEIKGFDIIIEIWGRISHKYPDWTLEIAGTSNNKDELERLLKIIRKNDVINRVKLLGHVENMKALYSESSIFALSSRMEGFPMVLMEAMSQGCACVAFEVNGATNEMMDESSGFIIKDGDYNDFQNKLEVLLSNEDKRLSISNNALKKVEKFSVSNFISEWEDLIDKTVRQGVAK